MVSVLVIIRLVSKPYLNTATTYCTLQRGGGGYPSNHGVAVTGCEGLVKYHYTVVAVEEDIAGVDGSGAGGIGGKCGIKVLVLLVAVEFGHVQGHGQKCIEGLGGGVVGQFGGEIGAGNGEFEGHILDAEAC